MRKEASSLISILSISFPKCLPRDDYDKIVGVLMGIHFPTFSQSELTVINDRAQSQSEYGSALEGMKFYFPLVPALLCDIADCDDCSQEVLEFSACVVLCSYISWRIFTEFTKDFEHLGIILNALPFVCRSSHSKLAVKLYIEAMNWYLSSSETICFGLIFPSMKRLFSLNRMYLWKIQNILPSILDMTLKQRDLDLDTDTRIFLDFLANATECEQKLDSSTAKDVVERISYHIGKMEPTTLHLFANLAPLLDKGDVNTICSTFPEELRNTLTGNAPVIKVREGIKTSIEFPVIELPKEIGMSDIQEETFKGTVPKEPLYLFEGCSQMDTSLVIA